MCFRPPKEKTKESASFRLRRKGNLKVLYPGVNKEILKNSKLVLRFKKYDILEKENSCLLCVYDQICNYFTASEFIINGVKGQEIFEDDDKLLMFDITPKKSVVKSNKINIQQHFEISSINDDNMDMCDNSKLSSELNFDELSECKNQIKELEIKNECLLKMMMKMNRKLNQLESITYNNLKSVEIDIDGDEDLKNNKETKETNVIPNSFVSNNDEIYDSAFYNELD